MISFQTKEQIIEASETASRLYALKIKLVCEYDSWLKIKLEFEWFSRRKQDA